MATSAWPEAVQRVTSFLREARAEVRVEEFPEGTPTAKAAASAVGCELGQIVKSLVFDCEGRKVLALVPGDRRADSGKVARAAGTSFARIAGSDEVREATGFDLAVADDLAETRAPNYAELVVIREMLDPKKLREREVPS